MLLKYFAKSLSRCTVVTVSLIMVAGCLPSGETDLPEQTINNDGGSSDNGNGDNGAVQNSAPEISGDPGTQGLVGTNYSFEPQASDADGDQLTFSVSALPSWAEFSNSTGVITGTPGDGDVGTYSGIRITVSDGEDSVSLAPFAIRVDAIAIGSATLSWTPPTQNTDGSALTDLAGYRIYWGSTSGNYIESVTIDNPGLSNYVVENLTPGQWHFVSTAINVAGVESSYSNEAIKIVM